MCLACNSNNYRTLLNGFLRILNLEYTALRGAVIEELDQVIHDGDGFNLQCNGIVVIIVPEHFEGRYSCIQYCSIGF